MLVEYIICIGVVWNAALQTMWYIEDKERGRTKR